MRKLETNAEDGFGSSDESIEPYQADGQLVLQRVASSTRWISVNSEHTVEVRE
jgi:hypothetical protein